MKVAFRYPTIRPRRALLAVAVACSLALAFVLPSHALDLVNFTGITGPLVTALTSLATLGPGARAIVGFLGFIVALIALTALRNFGPVLFYIGVAVFAAVGLPIAGAIMGAVI